MTLFSIVINNRNYARFLRDAIDGALMQSWPAVEVVVVDDGSTDESRSIIEGYGGAVQAHFLGHGGQTAAMNIGFGAATGEWIVFLDADDLIDHSAIARVARAIKTDTVKVHWPLRVVDSIGRGVGAITPNRRLSRGDLRTELLRYGPESQVYPPTSGNAWRASILRQLFPLPEVERVLGVGSASADYYLSCVVPLYGNVAAIDEPQGARRVHGGNDYEARDFWRKLRHDVWAFDHVAAALADHARGRGLQVHNSHWRGRSWIHARLRATEAITAVVPHGERVIVVDDDEWGLPPLLDGRQCLPLIEVSGQSWGPPASDEQAVVSLERARDSGVRFLLHSQAADWWLSAYPRFAAALTDSWRPVRTDARFVVYVSNQQSVSEPDQ